MVLCVGGRSVEFAVQLWCLIISMSRRSRIKMGSRSKQKFTLSHHSEYASTTTYFPRAYSIYGGDITFPISVLPITTPGKITYAGPPEDFFHRLDGAQVVEQAIKLVSISLSGMQYQASSAITNLAVLVFSMLCFCFYWLLSTSVYRKGHFPRYRLDDYSTLISIISRFSNVETLIINFQDNDLTPEKLKMLDKACYQTNVKILVLRNLTYFIEVQGLNEAFPLMRGKQGAEFKFIWQKKVISSEHRQQEEREQLLNDQL